MWAKCLRERKGGGVYNIARARWKWAGVGGTHIAHLQHLRPFRLPNNNVNMGNALKLVFLLYVGIQAIMLDKLEVQGFGGGGRLFRVGGVTLWREIDFFSPKNPHPTQLSHPPHNWVFRPTTPAFA